MDTNVKERPILFSGPMVRAILDNTKSQTRRIVKMPKNIDDAQFGYTCFTPEGSISVRGGHQSGEFGESFVKCPYGKPGDRLWVRESWWAPCSYRPIPHDDPYMFYRANQIDPARKEKGLPWKPSIHMPRWASRILLEIVSVRVERLVSISEVDAIAEGIVFDDSFGQGFDYGVGNLRAKTAKSAFAALFQSINGEDSWNPNTWVWVVEFKRIEGDRA